MILYTNSHYRNHSVLACKNILPSTHAVIPAQTAHVFLIIIIVFILVLRKCPFCMLDQPVEKSNIMEVQGELHPVRFPPSTEGIF